MITADLYDLIVLILVIVFAVRGYQKGLVNQLGALIALIVGSIISVRYTPSISDFMPGSGNTQAAVAFIVIVLVATLVVWNIVNALAKLVSKLKLNSWNNQMGMLFGVVNGIIMSMILTFLLLVFAVPQAVENEDGTYKQVTYEKDKSFIMKSKLGPYLTSATLTTIDHLPQGGDCRFYNYLREMLVTRAEEIKESNPDLPQSYETNPVSTYESGYNNRPNDRQYRLENNDRRYTHPSERQEYSNPDYSRNPDYGRNPDYERNPGYESHPGYQRNPDYGRSHGYPPQPGGTSYPGNQPQPGYNNSYPSHPFGPSGEL